MSTLIVGLEPELSIPSDYSQVALELSTMLPVAPSTKRAFKRRAPKACERCRTRKVRCDIVIRGDRCTNCALDEVECIDTLSRKEASEHETSSKRSRARKSQVAAKSPERHVERIQPFLESIPTLPELVSPPTTAITPSPDINCQEILESPQRPRRMENHFPDLAMGLLSDPETASCNESFSSPRTNFGHSTSMDGAEIFRNNNYGCPNFISPIKSTKCAQHSMFLHYQGAFDVLEEKLRNAVITSYIHFVHPQIPVVDIHELLQALATNGRDGKVSILLLQCILLSGCTFVEIEYVTQAGFESRMSLRRQLADRARLLYDFDCEDDRLILVQSLTLMTYWQEAGDEVKHLRHWIGIAYNISLFIGLNMDPAPSSLPLHRKHLWKRVWWCCYMRDQMLGLGLRHPPIIPADACRTPNLVLEDFDVRLPTSEVSVVFKDCGLILDTDQQNALAQVCIAQQQLCLKLSNVLKARYESIAPKLGCTTTRTLVSVPKTSTTNTPEIQNCAFELTSWYRDLPSVLRYQGSSSLQFGPEQDLLMFHCALLNLLYYTSLCVLQRPWPSPIVRVLPASEICAQRKSRLAANAMVSILKDLQVLEMVHLLPTSGITSIVQAAIVHLGDSGTDTASLRDQSRKQLDTCLDILDNLVEVHSYSLYAKSFLVQAAAKIYREPNYMSRLEAPGVPATHSHQFGDGSIFGRGSFKLPSLFDVSLPGDITMTTNEDSTSLLVKDNSDILVDTRSDLLEMFDYGQLDLGPDLFLNLGPADFDNISRE